MKRNFVYTLILAVLFVASVTALIAIKPARASATINVTITTDGLNSTDGFCSLREAIIAANTDTPSGGTLGECVAGSGADTIVLPAGIYALTKTGFDEHDSGTGDLNISTTLTISGAGSASTIIDGNGTDRSIEILPAGIVTITGVTIQNGAAAGYGGGGIINRNKLYLQSSMLISNTAIGSGGGGLYSDNGTTSVLTGVTAINNSSGSGGAVRNNGDMTIVNFSLISNSATFYGGGLFNSYALLSLSNGQILSSSAAIDGGGILNDANLRINRTTIAGNTAKGSGGGLDLPTVFGGSAIISGSTFFSNSAGIIGGALAVETGTLAILTNTLVISNATDQNGGGLWNAGAVRMTNGGLSQNRSGTFYSGGGALNSSSGKFILDDVDVMTNTAYTGGGIFNTGDLTVTNNSRLISNTAIGASIGGGGGGIYGYGNQRVVIVNSQLSKNSGDLGGGVLMSSGTLIVTGSTIDRNNAPNISGLGFGGGIYAEPANVSIVNSRIMTNTADYFAGGLYLSGTATISGSIVRDNSVAGISGSGGGIVAVGGVTIVNSSLISNSANASGGGISAGSSAVLRLLTSIVMSNSVNAAGIIQGGGIDSYGQLIIDGTTIARNHADGSGGTGGGIANGGVLTLTNSSVSTNTIGIGGYGGGLANGYGATAIIMTTTIGGNQSGYPSDGSGVSNSGIATATATTVIYNTSLGAAAVQNGGDLWIVNSSIISNTNNSDGGGLKNNGTATIWNSSISSNTAASGGGIFNSSGATLIAILNTLINGNTAASSCSVDCVGGGGIFNTGGNVSLSDMSVIGNASIGGGNVGGGLFNLNGGVMEIKNVDLNLNTSQTKGGGAFNGYGSYMEMSVDRVMTNTVAQYGGGVVNSGTLVIDNSILAGNIVTADAIFVGGGAIQNFGILTVTASTIASNTARLGGGIQNDAVAVLALIDSSISYNSATNYAGLSLSGQVSVLNSTIDHNTSLGNGAGLNNRGNLALTNSTISSNRISFGGWGAGLDNQSGMAQLINVSVISNTSTIGGAGFHTLGALYLTNTLLAGNVWMSSAQANCGGTTYTSRGYNLSSDATCTLLNATGDMTNVNPHIGPLANNGGSTWTHALRVGSPAIDRGTNAGCPSTDQRGIARPQLVKCDIGAYEYDGVLKIVFLPLTLKNY